jgi:hypothetical protein
MFDFDKDWMEIARNVVMYFGGKKLEGLLPPSFGFKDPEANSLVEEARSQAERVTSSLEVKAAIRAVADLLLNANPDSDGCCIVKGNQIIAVCEQIFGEEPRLDDKCSVWIEGP